MKARIARKIARHPIDSKKLQKRIKELYPPYYNELGHYCLPSAHSYYRITKAWIIVNRKHRKYKENFKLL